jgi:hypothetical protein
LIDGVELYGLDSGQYIAFSVPVGERIVGIKSWDPNALIPTSTYPAATLNAELGRTYYFRVYINLISRTTVSRGP